MQSPPRVDVIVPVHTAARPIERAVASVVDGTVAPVRVLVVAHNVVPESIRASLGRLAGHPAVELLELADGIPSPAGPRNHGLDHATAQFFAFLDSDDTLAPGALDSWLALADDAAADAVLARIERGTGGAADPLPPTRPGRERALHAVKDRLAYRSEPVGLISRARFPRLRFTPELLSGEDLAVSAELWFSGAAIAYDRSGPAYRFGDDAVDRVTANPRSLAADFAFLDAVSGSAWFRGLRRSERRVFGVKVFRLHFFDAVLARLHDRDGSGGLAAHRAELAELVTRIERIAPGSLALLSRRDRAAIAEVSSPAGTPDSVLTLLEARWLGGVDAMLTRNPFLSLHRQGPRRTLRDMVA
ncbi:glycosyltransferase family 2 protein [Leucobacter luti]|uniref:Glycosyltransferase involved in cell wall biosynthesis n=1 Tax=Leucobacter luti TaxID=340320 RepID=A0A4Q7TR28_9MICO|nr:glycosyltransferase family A protein [Leucobacter luti]MBL3699725.1 glycosyltransferase family 2 protein [Leucobacter luti]RZT62953.1 glycosyltransferase involved in cell wall biosynthesis [Leucobacter luti]